MEFKLCVCNNKSFLTSDISCAHGKFRTTLELLQRVSFFKYILSTYTSGMTLRCLHDIGAILNTSLNLVLPKIFWFKIVREYGVYLMLPSWLRRSHTAGGINWCAIFNLFSSNRWFMLAFSTRYVWFALAIYLHTFTLIIPAVCNAYSIFTIAWKRIWSRSEI